MLLLNGKSFSKSKKDLKLIYLRASTAFELYVVSIKHNEKSMFGVTGDDQLVFPAQLLLYSLSI